MQALEDVELLNIDEDPKPCENLNEDHWSYIVIYQNANNTDAKYRAINARIQMYIQSGQAEADNAAMKTL